ncbi:hypothetical protein [Kiloniella antarctica]|uniref:DUF4376 domain-containing protein n=1 Tax=Kiloniella antarctica TaxID=1550907 RepID=A0ABW5BM07_9PROT
MLYETNYDIMAGGFTSVDLEVAVQVSLVDDALNIGDVSLFVSEKNAYFPCDDEVLARRIQDFILDDEAEYSQAIKKAEEVQTSPFDVFADAIREAAQ